jgi:Co/Zn/Cd efflux system component
MTQISIILPDCPIPRLSNQALLEISLCLFLVFVIAEIVGAFASTSLSLLGDAACMSVDIATYIGNAYVEWLKTSYGTVSVTFRYYIDVVIPAISVTALLGMTVYITIDATQVLYAPPAHDTVDIRYLYAYSTANFVIDMICSVLFYCNRNNVFTEQLDLPRLSLDTTISLDDEREFGYLDDDSEPSTPLHHLYQASSSSTGRDPSKRSGCCNLSNTADYPTLAHHLHSHHGGRKNLNMISAFAHILGDTLRTISMFAAAVASTWTGIDGDVCDAGAAVVVTITILVICWPLIVEIRKAAVGLREETRDEMEVELCTAQHRGASSQQQAGWTVTQSYMLVSDQEEEGTS